MNHVAEMMHKHSSMNDKMSFSYAFKMCYIYMIFYVLIALGVLCLTMFDMVNIFLKCQ